jgi:hypothetical protein
MALASCCVNGDKPRKVKSSAKLKVAAPLKGSSIPTNNARPDPNSQQVRPRFVARRNVWTMEIGAPTTLMKAWIGP